MAADDPDTVCIWVCVLKGSQAEIGARADEQLAKAWIERRIDSDGRWEGGRGKQIYRCESLDSGTIELVPVHDVAAMLVEDP